MTRRKRLFLWISAGTATAAILTLFVVYWAAQHEPAFYREAMNIKPAVLEKGSDRMLQQAAAVQGSTTRDGRWQVRVTATEINGWLAVDLVKNHPKLLPPTMKNPRVAIDRSGITVACHFQHGNVTSVLSLTVQPSMPKRNVIALRIAKARAGLLPAPLEQVIERITKSARDLQFHVQWERAGGDPVALLTLPDDPGNSYRTTLEAVELGDGEIRIVGNTQRRNK